MEQNLKKFLISDSVMGINDLLYKIFYVRSCLGRSILFLADRVGNNLSRTIRTSVSSSAACLTVRWRSTIRRRPLLKIWG